jgi:hypothetical protein
MDYNGVKEIKLRGLNISMEVSRGFSQDKLNSTHELGKI